MVNLWLGFMSLTAKMLLIISIGILFIYPPMFTKNIEYKTGATNKYFYQIEYVNGKLDHIDKFKRTGEFIVEMKYAELKGNDKIIVDKIKEP